MKKILIVEDDPSAAKVLQQRLNGSGYVAFCAGDAYQGLLTAKNEMPDLIILDLKIPAGGGDSTFHNLKRSYNTSMIPVLVLTASRDPVLKKKMLDEGVEGYMEKPYEASELLWMINEILQKRSRS